VQFGLDYGIANSEGKVSLTAAKEILSVCKVAGIDMIDTAMAYGESELCLGRVGVEGFDVVTKIPSVPVDCIDVVDSMARLHVESLYGLMLHRPDEIFSLRGEEILKALKGLKKTGLVKKIGVSVYSPDELEDLFALHDFDIVQCPFNIIDNRLVTTGWLDRLKALDVEVHVRSSFLQGLLLMSRDKIPKQFEAWDFLWDQWHQWIKDSEVSAVEACLAYALYNVGIDKVVVGVDSKIQLEQIVFSLEGSNIESFPDISSLDSNLINPSNWDIV
jgi:aryl-alcohol dehydrogenase-like predicted oxidoreductase